jgi:hypothetical protein
VFTIPDAVAWLGIDWLAFLEAENILTGRHGGPLVGALLDARDAQGTFITPAQVLAKHGIDPANPCAAARAYDRQRSFTTTAPARRNQNDGLYDDSRPDRNESASLN